MEEYKHYSMGGPASPCVFLTKPTRPPRSSNTQGLAGPLLYFLAAILGYTAVKHQHCSPFPHKIKQAAQRTAGTKQEDSRDDRNAARQNTLFQIYYLHMMLPEKSLLSAFFYAVKYKMARIPRLRLSRKEHCPFEDRGRQEYSTQAG